MAIVGATFGITNGATLVLTPGVRQQQDLIPATLVNASGSTIWIGGASVASTGAFGIPLFTQTSIAFQVGNGDNLYAVGASGTTQTLAMIIGRQ